MSDRDPAQPPVSSNPQHAPESYVVLGTAGHIDHGKTSLVKALTGVDCDTLTEEKQRGITINLGFASWQPSLPDGTSSGLTFGVVDVPGHQRFIRNMVAGAIGIDLLLLVVAADDGVMPQTIEHLHIARLLGVKAGVVALNKCDLVDAELLELAIADAEQLLASIAASHPALAQAPIVPVSAVSGAGLDTLAAKLIEAAQSLPQVQHGDRFRMPVDRSFSVRGSGTVVTGTTTAGQLAIGDEVEVLPAGKRARVRGIQTHGAVVTAVGPGRRAAVNLAGIEKHEIERGHVLVTPDSLVPTYLFDAELELLPGDFRPLRRGSEAQLHIGTSEVTAKLHPLVDEYLAPGETALVQLALEQQIAVAAGDHFILRNSASERTIGGGRVLDAHPTKHRRQRQAAAEKLEVLAQSGTLQALLHEVEKSPFGITQAQLQRLLNISGERLRELCREAGAAGYELMEHDAGRQRILTMPANRQRIIDDVMAQLGSYYQSRPLARRGLDARDLLKMVDLKGVGLTSEVLRWCLNHAAEQGLLAIQGENYSLPNRSVELTARDQRAAELIVKRLDASVQPDQPDEFVGELPIDKGRLKMLLEYLVDEGQIVLAPGGVYFGTQVVARIRSLLLTAAGQDDNFSVSRFGEVAGTTRKYSIPLLQYFEQDGTLVREGDIRRLRH